MGIGHVLMTDSRLKLVDFTTAPYLVEYAYIVHEPLPLDPFKVWAIIHNMIQSLMQLYFMLFKECSRTFWRFALDFLVRRDRHRKHGLLHCA